ncbi:large neutral amino acids transporter small subunit 1-like isoform X1 [Leptotrombidium deliense]|uniref:Large neutral amino acids transporter small subunit 1-like isoform X1 n=1 Tax=Leptotrombidium deliense TaxID=299467 RepID=A0A443S924_9ACAR|nr:large neutral amino acids transporter small subunit 1-like isoform X1 [Leptotrombidium deliense]
MISRSSDISVTVDRRITLLNAVGLIVGSMIGSGIFITPKAVFDYTGQSSGMSICVWLFCGIFSTIGALCYSELGTSISRSGGDYVYQLQAFGKLTAFLYLWVSILVVNPASQAITSMTFAYYSLGLFYPTCEPPTLAVKIIAICCLRDASDLMKHPFRAKKAEALENLSLAVYSSLFAFGGW